LEGVGRMKKVFEEMLVEMLNKKARVEVAYGRQKIQALEKELAEAKKELEVHEKDINDFCEEFNYELTEGNHMKNEPALYLKKVVKKRATKK
jgi:phage host-nuclease inhibitor protein Gam